MNIDELKEFQKKIIKKNKICNCIAILITIIAVLLNLIIARGMRQFIVISIFFGIVIFIVSLVLLKLIINGKDTSLFKKEYKNIFVLNALNKYFDDVTYNLEKGFDEQEIKKYGMLNTSDRFTSNDYICGTYKTIKFEQSDIHIEEKYEEKHEDGHTTTTWVTIFRGRYMIFDFNKNFKSNIQVISSGFYAHTLPWNKKFSKVKLEDIDFNKKFSVYSEIEHDAFYILTPHFMEKIKKIYNESKADIMLCFIDNRLHVVVNNYEDSFEYNVLKPINEDEINNSIIKDIKLITDFVNDLNLDNDLFK